MKRKTLYTNKAKQPKPSRYEDFAARVCNFYKVTCNHPNFQCYVDEAVEPKILHYNFGDDGKTEWKQETVSESAVDWWLKNR